jgi:hypothetical protein
VAFLPLLFSYHCFSSEVPFSVDLTVGTNLIEFGGILPGKKFVQIGIFSESLESFIIHLNNHLNKCNGTKSMRAGSGGIELDVVSVSVLGLVLVFVFVLVLVLDSN